MTTDMLTSVVVIVALLLLSTVALIHNGNATATIPAPEIIYTATATAAPLVAHGYGLTGQATAVVRSSGKVTVIVERPTVAPIILRRADALFLAAEGLVAEEALGVAITSAILRYTDRDITLPLTVALRSVVIQRIHTMQSQLASGPLLTAQDPAVCRTCSYRSLCPIGRVNVALPHSSM